MDSSWAPKGEDDKLEALYSEFLRQQEAVEKRIILEFMNLDVERARDLVALLAPSDKGYRRIRYGEDVYGVPSATETNTFVVATVAKRMAETDLDSALLFLSQHLIRLEEPVFSPILPLLAFVHEKDPVKSEEIELLLRQRADRLLKSKNRIRTLQTHGSLADFLAPLPEHKSVASWSEFVLSRTPESYADQFPAELQQVAAKAYHQYNVATARFEGLETTSSKFKSLRDRTLNRLAIDPKRFEEMQLTVDVVKDPRRFAQAIRFRNQEFGEQLMRDIQRFELMRDQGTKIQDIEAMFAAAEPQERIGLAMILNEKLYESDRGKAESYLRKARALAEQEHDLLKRLQLQNMLYAQAINRCSEECLRELADDTVKTAERILEAHNPNPEKEAVYLGTMLGSFIHLNGREDFWGTVERIQGLPNPWLRAHFLTILVESDTREDRGNR